MYFLVVLRPEVQDQGAVRASFLLDLCAQITESYLFIVLKQGLSSVHRRTQTIIWGLFIIRTFIIRTSVLQDQGPTLVTSFSLYQFLIGSISKYCHTGDLGFNVWIFGERQFSSYYICNIFICQLFLGFFFLITIKLSQNSLNNEVRKIKKTSRSQIITQIKNELYLFFKLLCLSF